MDDVRSSYKILFWIGHWKDNELSSHRAAGVGVCARVEGGHGCGSDGPITERKNDAVP